MAEVADAGVQPVYSLRVDTDDHAFITNGFVSHNTECRLTPLAMAMLQDIDEDTVDFTANYDGKTQEPDVLPSRIPNLLINGSSGIAVGMATNIPPHNLREVGAGVVWALEHPEAAEEELLAALMERIKGPDFPTAGLIVGRDGIEEAYRTGRGSVRMRAVVEVEEDAKGRTILVVTELPYQVNPDNLIESIAELVRDGKLAGIAEIDDESSDRIGMRIVVTLKRDAVAKVVLNNLYKHTQLQYGFGVQHAGHRRRGAAHAAAGPGGAQLRRATRSRSSSGGPRYRLRKAEERAHILRGYVKALDRARRGHRADPGVGDGRRRPHGPDGAARRRRDPGPGDPGHAAAPPGRPGAPEDHRRAGRDRARDRRPEGHPRPAGAAAADRPRRAGRDRREVRRRPADR